MGLMNSKEPENTNWKITIDFCSARKAVGVKEETWRLKSFRMDVFLMIRRKKMTIFTDTKETTSVHELKKIIEGILKIPPEHQQLFNKDNQLMEDDKTLQDYGLTSVTAKAQCPAPVGLAFRQDSGDFEPLELTPFSSPPDLPDVMKAPESNGQEQSS
ncbi:hypothetical protein J437_LFUL004885 [Ladona fulva]|uniref:Elongin-B n=1 Tax=Ladona fulva TaxID=123851 RepID=A0A8K0JXZ3_LADFU|nr:hypothetical protein J437_LFUL004885 [Ladona fulva]